MHTKWLWDIMPCELRLDDPEGTVLLRCTHTHEPSEGTKRLIKAAPELLEALETVTAFLDEGVKQRQTYYKMRDVVTEAIRKAKNALSMTYGGYKSTPGRETMNPKQRSRQ